MTHKTRVTTWVRINGIVNYLKMVNRKSNLSDNGYGQRVYSLGDSKPDGNIEFTIWYMVKNVCGEAYPLLEGLPSEEE